MSDASTPWSAAGGSRRFALARGEEPRLTVDWKPRFETATFTVDDVVLATVAKRQLKDGRSFSLADGSELRVRLRRDYFSFSLDLARDGRPLPGSPGALKPPYQLAYRILYFLAGLNLGGSLVLFNLSQEQLGRIRPGWMLLSGSVYLVLGMSAHRRSAGALALGIAVFAGDGVRSVVEARLAGEGAPWWGLAFRGVLIWGMIRGISPTRLLPTKERSVPPWADLAR